MEPKHNLVYKHGGITEKIIAAAYKVHNTLGFGFLEKVYENALLIELSIMGLKAEQQKPLTVWYEGKVVGEFFIDLLVEEKVIVEVKAVKKVIDIHEIQVVNYLKGSKLEVGLLLNFSTSLEIKRKFFKKSEKSGAK